MELLEYKGRQVALIPKPIKHCYLRVKPDGVIMLTYNKRLNKTEVLKIIDNNRKSIEQKLLLLPKIENNNFY